MHGYKVRKFKFMKARWERDCTRCSRGGLCKNKNIMLIYNLTKDVTFNIKPTSTMKDLHSFIDDNFDNYAELYGSNYEIYDLPTKDMKKRVTSVPEFKVLKPERKTNYYTLKLISNKEPEHKYYHSSW